MESLTLKHFFIFNPTLESKKTKPSDDEVQEAKLLFYYPQSESKLVKLSNMGIIEGTLGFMDGFESTNSQLLITELNKFYYIANNYERDVMIVLILQKPVSLFYNHQNILAKKQWFKMLLDNFYSMLYLFHGEIMKMFFSEGNDIRDSQEQYANLSLRLEDFVTNYFEHYGSMKMPFLNNVVYICLYDQSQAGILLSVQRLHEKIPDLKMTSIIYKGHIIHNQLPLDSFNLIYNLFYSSFEFSPKFNSFNKPPYETVQLTNTNNALNQENNISSSQNNGSINAIKEDKVSPFRKVFDLGMSVTNEFLIGIKRASGNNNSNNNTYNIFIPTIFIQSTNEKYKLLVYYYDGMILFMFLDEKFNSVIRLNDTLVKIDKWIKKYFEEHFTLLDKCYKQKISMNDSISYSYCNNANYSVKLSSSFISKKTKTLDSEKFELLRTTLELNSDAKISSLTRYKGNYLYYINSCERKIVMIYNDNIPIGQLKTLIDSNKKELFDSIFIL